MSDIKIITIVVMLNFNYYLINLKSVFANI